MENIPALPVSESSAVLPPSAKKRHLLRSWFLGIGGALILGGGVAAYFVLGVSNPAAGIPIPNIDGSLAFRVPEASLMANATYTRDDGQIVHYIDKPSVIERAWTEKNHHIIIRFTDAFGLTGEEGVDPQSVILGQAFTTFCTDDVTHVTDAWYYVYTTPTFEKEKTGEFPPERFRLGHCKNILQSFADRYNATPKIKSGDLVYVAIPPAEVEKLENATDRQGSSVTLSAATSTDKDMDGLLDLTETQIGSNPELFDTDADGLSDGLEVAGGNYRVMISGKGLTRNLAAYTLSWSNPDTDHDGLRDATELGLTVSQDPHPELSISFVADADPLTVTNPAMEDTDSGGSKDGEEDANANGKVDNGETDPNNREDDLSIPLPPPPGDSCKNGLDDDGDTLIDLLDAGCADAEDQNEGDGATDLEVKKTGPAEATNGSKVTYVITVTNKGPDAITSAAAILDNVPTGLEYIDAESHAECEATTNNNTIRCGNIKLAKDAHVSFSLVFHVTTTLDVCGKEVTNMAFASETPQGDSNEANSTSSVSTKITCVAPPLTCGNGTLEDGETCDDRNVVSGDGCSALCATESGYTCAGTPSVCKANPVCGNGTKDDNEECDDGNALHTDACLECKLTVCGDHVVQNPNGRGEAEECDEDSPICTDECKDLDLPPPLASGLNITALKFDADGREPGEGVFDAATFRFSFTPEATSGLQKAELRDIFFFVKSFNIEMAANGFVLYNKNVNYDILSRCLPLRDGVPFDTGVVSGTFLVECRDVPVSGVPAMITANSNQDFVFRMTINNKQVTSNLEYGLQVSLDQFTDFSKTAFGHNQSHVHWTGSGSETQGTVTEFFFAHGKDPLRSTLYGSFFEN